MSDARPLVIAGSGRSGTTWVADTLAEANGLRVLFEPLHPVGVPRARDLADRYLPADAQLPELEPLMRAMLHGELRGIWPELRVRPDRLTRLSTPHLVAAAWWKVLTRGPRRAPVRRRRAVVKFIRANLMLPWLVRRFDARVVLVLRHPGGMIASKEKLIGPEWRPGPRLAAYLRDEALVAEHLSGLREALSAGLSTVEAHAAVWCIENAIPCRQAAEWGIEVVCYEHLLRGDRPAWEALVGALGLGGLPSAALRAKPSQQVARDMAGQHFDETHLGRWMQRIGEADRAAIQRILDLFGVESYRASDPLPRMAAA